MGNYLENTQQDNSFPMCKPYIGIVSLVILMQAEDVTSSNSIKVAILCLLHVQGSFGQKFSFAEFIHSVW